METRQIQSEFWRVPDRTLGSHSTLVTPFLILRYHLSAFLLLSILSTAAALPLLGYALYRVFQFHHRSLGGSTIWPPSCYSNSCLLPWTILLSQRVCLSVCLSVTRLYCVQTAKTTLELFRPSDSPIMLVFWLLAPIHNSNGNPVSGARNTRGNLRLSTEISVYLGNSAI